MTDIEAKALALVNELFAESGGSPIDYAALFGKSDIVTFALCRAIERHEAFKQEVSDIVQDYSDHVDGGYEWNKLMGLITKPKPDPLVEVLDKMLRRRFLDPLPDVLTDEAHWLRAELEARGLEIREKGQ